MTVKCIYQCPEVSAQWLRKLLALVDSGNVWTGAEFVYNTWYATKPLVIQQLSAYNYDIYS
jgi:hypothetical protein